MARMYHALNINVASPVRLLSATKTILRILPNTSSTTTRQRFFSTTNSFQFSNTTSKMTVHNIVGMDEFKEKVIQASESNPVVIDCFATWCGPCKIIAPVLEKMSDEPSFSKVNFVKIDVDASPDVAQELGIRAMPTFVVYKSGQKVNELVGADPAKLKAMVESAV